MGSPEDAAPRGPPSPCKPRQGAPSGPASSSPNAGLNSRKDSKHGAKHDPAATAAFQKRARAPEPLGRWGGERCTVLERARASVWPGEGGLVGSSAQTFPGPRAPLQLFPNLERTKSRKTGEVRSTSRPPNSPVLGPSVASSAGSSKGKSSPRCARRPRSPFPASLASPRIALPRLARTSTRQKVLLQSVCKRCQGRG